MTRRATAAVTPEPGAVHDVFDSRYARQLVLKGFGADAQGRLAAARVLIVGAGGLGSPAAMYLAAAGVGAITLVDADVVDLTNIHRQLLYGTEDVGRRKTEAAQARLADINPHVQLRTHTARFDRSNASSLVAGHDVVIDATDNFPTRYAINDACLAASVPFVYGSVARFEGQVTIFATPSGPCYRCLFPDPPAPGSVPSCAEEGVLGIVPGIIGLHQALETIKLLAGIGTPLAGKLMLLDLLGNDTRIITIDRRADCPACGDAACGDAARAGAASGGAGSTPNRRQDINVNSGPLSFSPKIPQLSATELAARLGSSTPPRVLDVREQWEYDIAHLEGSQLIPLTELQATVPTLDKSAEYVLLCHHGMRSEMAAQWMAAQGFSKVYNLAGGIDAWSETVNPDLARY